jgi:hypothetical protein
MARTSPSLASPPCRPAYGLDLDANIAKTADLIRQAADRAPR